MKTTTLGPRSVFPYRQRTSRDPRRRQNPRPPRPIDFETVTLEDSDVDTIPYSHEVAAAFAALGDEYDELCDELFADDPDLSLDTGTAQPAAR